MKGKRATIQFRIEPELKERLERVATEKALNISALLRKWIEEFVEREEKSNYGGNSNGGHDRHSRDV